MKIFVFTYDRFNSIQTSPLLEDEKIEHFLLCHSEEAKQNFIAAGRVNPERLIATNQPKGLGHNRNVALEMMDKDEWALFLVDDIKSVTELQGHDKYIENYIPITMDNQMNWKWKFKEALTMKGFVNRATQLAEFCDSVNSYLGGFCGIDNPPFRKRHYTFNTFADGRAWVVKKSHLRFDPNVHCIDDYGWNALNIKTFGINVVNQWVLPDSERYSPGGYGSIQQRSAQKLIECEYLVKTFPNQLAFKDKKGHAPKTHITLRPQRKPNWITPQQLGQEPKS